MVVCKTDAMTITDVPPNGDCFYNVIQLSLATLPEPVTTYILPITNKTPKGRITTIPAPNTLRAISQCPYTPLPNPFKSLLFTTSHSNIRQQRLCLRCLRKYFVGWWAVIVSVVSVPLSTRPCPHFHPTIFT